MNITSYLEGTSGPPVLVEEVHLSQDDTEVDATDSIAHLDALGVPTVEDDELTDAEFSDNEKRRIRRRGL